MSFLENAKARALSTVRRGGREIAWAPEWMNLGNLLFLGQWAFEGQAGGADRKVLLHPKHEKTVGLFPRLRHDLFVTPANVRFLDQRVMPWSGQAEVERAAFTDAEAAGSYIREALLAGSPLATDRPDLEDSWVVNVRRGDYYSVPENRASFGMDQVTYVDLALQHLRATGPLPERIVVISDELDWCRENLSLLLSPIALVVYEEGDVEHDLRALVHARRLVLPNSTFSYWGGYIGDVAHPGRDVVAPWFFSRTQDGGRASQLRPHWTALTGDFY
ncbi:alpha-1,2-fucosyltransferase [Micrococcus endophyticus]|uniref:alpha-1,2-fucosyltransferase n=1 Tax=Micrococcus endophyticus TaxID=455343 RepID=UPI0034CD38B5